jgi:Delta7-sterol 5-desaturase
MTFEMYLRSLVQVLALYFGSVALCYGLVHKWNYLRGRKIESDVAVNLPLKMQFRYSIVYLFGAAFFNSLFLAIAYERHTKIYNQVEYMGVWYFAGSVILYILSYEVFFYFSHRMLHTNFLYKHVHHVHHLVRSPTVASIFCFHPLEALAFFIFHIGFVFLVPIHPTALIISSLFLHQGNVVGHLGYEIFPDKIKEKWIYLNTATGHFLHHQNQNCNYGYAFTVLDKIFKTYKIFPLSNTEKATN